MPTDLILFVASLLVAWLIFSWLIKVIKTSVTTAIIIVIIVMFLQITLGISPEQLWHQIINLPQNIQQLFEQIITHIPVKI
ncbi:MAG TPA: hypothetical protein DCF68_02055 [Cyanothece sp. UBA12306]|nr:hypothetical protein [Cyanothece sp. UBA12306]